MRKLKTVKRFLSELCERYWSDAIPAGARCASRDRQRVID
jgi:hypothetical protein